MRRILSLLLAFWATAASAQWPPGPTMLGGANLSANPPANSIGTTGNYYLDFASGNIWGPKDFGVWPSSTSAVVLLESSGGAYRDTTTHYSLDGTGVGWFSDYNQRGAARINLWQSTDLSAIPSGSFRDGLLVNHVDGDGTNYTASGIQRVSYGVRSVVTGVLSGADFIQQYKDLVALDGTCIARISWSIRGCSGINANAIQYDNAVASNEFSAQNPAAANAQAASMAAVQGILYPHKADVDGSHFAFGLWTANIEGYKATAGVYVASQAHGSDPARDGAYLVGLNMAGSIATEAGIKMPACRAASVACKIIEYDTNDYTYFNPATNTYVSVIGGNVAGSLSATGPTFAMPTSAGAGGLYVCIDTAGVMYKKATCP